MFSSKDRLTPYEGRMNNAFRPRPLASPIVGGPCAGPRVGPGGRQYPPPRRRVGALGACRRSRHRRAYLSVRDGYTYIYIYGHQRFGSLHSYGRPRYTQHEFRAHFLSVFVSTRYTSGPPKETTCRKTRQKKNYYTFQKIKNKHFFRLILNEPNGRPSRRPLLSNPSRKRFTIFSRKAPFSLRRIRQKVRSPPQDNTSGSVRRCQFFVRGPPPPPIDEMTTTAKMVRCCAAVVLALCAAHAATAYPASVRRPIFFFLM